MQAIKLISRALRIIKVLDAAEAPEAEDAETALEALNQMLTQWEADGIALGFSAIEKVTDELPIPPEAERAVTYSLASELRIEYGVAPDPKVEVIARDGYKALLRSIFATTDLTLRVGSGGGMWDIYTDSFGPRRY